MGKEKKNMCWLEQYSLQKEGVQWIRLLLNSKIQTWKKGIL